jgi:demethylmenaquinone methyltransferase/2-methoxy-6-polyprenyl-1,4-benzoquinol methylase
VTNNQKKSNTPQSGAISSGTEVKSMFDRIVPRYDLMNHVMTFGMDIRWRKMIARQAAELDERKSTRVLDVATGTGDVAFAIRKAGVPEVVGLDFTPGMIEAAKKKADEKPDGIRSRSGCGTWRITPWPSARWFGS